MTTVVLFIAVISLVIVIHELGHFAAAKAFGIEVKEFAVGFPPRIFSVVRGETRYSINAIPLGGYVKMVGEEDPTEAGEAAGQITPVTFLEGSAADMGGPSAPSTNGGAPPGSSDLEDEEAPEMTGPKPVNPRSLAAQSIPLRITVLGAGVVMNFVLAIVLFSVFFTFPGEVVGARVAISSVAPGSPAEKAGIQPGDIVLLTNPRSDIGSLTVVPSPDTMRPSDVSERYGGDPVESISDLISYTEANLGREVSLLLERNSVPVIVRLVPRLAPPPGEGPMGVGIGTTGGRVVSRFDPRVTVVSDSLRQLYRILTSYGAIFSVEGREGVLGPIGIAQLTGEVARSGVLPLIGLTATLSFIIGLFNVLPIPALDGGRLAFVLIEAARRGKKIPPQREAIIHLAGFVLLIAFMIFVTISNDIPRLLSGDNILP